MYYPIQREILLNCGFSSASENSLKTLLNQSNDANDLANLDGYTSNGVGLIVGGVPEAFFTYPNSYKCYLRKRRGFVRVALQTGATLVPAISYGENDIYDIIGYNSGFWLNLVQKLFRKFNRFKHFNAAGILKNKFGLLPKRQPITIVVGAPIRLRKIPSPSKEEINKIHEYFCKRLNELFETHKSKYIENFENVRLEII